MPVWDGTVTESASRLSFVSTSPTGTRTATLSTHDVLHQSGTEDFEVDSCINFVVLIGAVGIVLVQILLG